ncbi:hypothetical protein BJY00DRAFT_317998 [Aspergillus carlsbadensis]|nr:hypothetical protein BJY00DRAFT_317998 [Aspergillus carlsbadensis]
MESITNEITLDSAARMMWDEGNIGLKPLSVSSDRTAMEVEIHYLPEHDGSPMDLETCPADLTVREPFLLNPVTGSEIGSGDVISLVTPSPDRFPLPDFDLLEMRWVLSRLVALSGVAHDYGEEENDDEDQEDYG